MRVKANGIARDALSEYKGSITSTPPTNLDRKIDIGNDNDNDNGNRLIMVIIFTTDTSNKSFGLDHETNKKIQLLDNLLDLHITITQEEYYIIKMVILYQLLKMQINNGNKNNNGITKANDNINNNNKNNGITKANDNVNVNRNDSDSSTDSGMNNNSNENGNDNARGSVTNSSKKEK